MITKYQKLMKTVILFSSIFYLLGLKLGTTIDILKRIATPVRSLISAPVPEPEKPGKTYYFLSGEKESRDDTKTTAEKSEKKENPPSKSDLLPEGKDKK